MDLKLFNYQCKAAFMKDVVFASCRDIVLCGAQIKLIKTLVQMFG